GIPVQCCAPEKNRNHLPYTHQGVGFFCTNREAMYQTSARQFFSLGVLSILLLLYASASAQTSPELVREVTVQGNKRREAEAILKEVKSRTGEPLNYDQIRKDIIAIYEMGLFSDVQA